MFSKHIGKTMEVYVDDVVIKILKREDHFAHLVKCNFGVELGKFLSCLVSKRGIEANPAKVKAILDMGAPRSVKEVQKLTSFLAALNRFISRMGEYCKPLFDTL